MATQLSNRGWFVLGGITVMVIIIGLTAVVWAITSLVSSSVNRYHSGYYHGYTNSRSHHSSYHHYQTRN